MEKFCETSRGYYSNSKNEKISKSVKGIQLLMVTVNLITKKSKILVYSDSVHYILYSS